MDTRKTGIFAAIAAAVFVAGIWILVQSNRRDVRQSTASTPSPAALPAAPAAPALPAAPAGPVDPNIELRGIRAEIESNDGARGDLARNEIVDAGFEFLANHLADEAVAKFDPLAGFTHYTVTSDGNGSYWLLIERPDPNRGGLNLKYDPATKRISEVKAWGAAKPKA